MREVVRELISLHHIVFEALEELNDYVLFKVQFEKRLNDLNADGCVNHLHVKDLSINELVRQLRMGTSIVFLFEIG